jgi:glutathione S-transferase
MWMDWQVSDFNNSWRACYQGIVKRNPEFQDKALIERSLSDFNAHVAIIDKELARTGGYICGPDFTLADIPIGLSIHRWRALPADKPSLSHVEAYYSRLCDRPGFQTYGRDGGP